MNISDLAVRIHEDNCERGWWDNPNRCLYECLQLASTEVAEATEGERKNLMDDHLPHRRMGEVELADTLIRVLDLAGRLKIPLQDEAIQTQISANKSYLHDMHKSSVGKRHLLINAAIVNFAELLNEAGPEQRLAMHALIGCIYMIGQTFGYDIDGAMMEKLEYNRNRPDHSREARAAANGKKF